MIFTEIKKIIREKTLLLFFIMLIIIDCVTCANAISSVKAEGFSIESEVQYVASYGDFLKQIPEQAKILMQTSEYQNRNTFLYRNLAKTVEEYSHLNADNVKAFDHVGIRAFAQYDLGILFAIAFAIAISYFAISVERKQGIFPLIKCTKKGRFELYYSKVIAVSILTALAATILFLAEFSVVYLFCGMHGLSLRVQSLEIFRDSTFFFSIRAAIICMLLFRILIAVVLSNIALALNVLIQKNGVSELLFVGILAAFYYFEKIFSEDGSLAALKVLNVFYCWNMEKVFGVYKNINFFGLPVGKTEMAAYVFLIPTALLNTFAEVRFSKTLQVSRDSVFEKFFLYLRRKTAFIHRNTSVSYFETMKNLFLGKKWVLIPIMIFISVVCTRYFRKPLYFSKSEDAEYYSLIHEIQGPITEEKLDNLIEKRKHINDLYEQEKGLTNSTDDYFQKLMIDNEILSQEGGLSLVEEQLKELKKKLGEITQKYFVDEMSYADIFSDYKYDILIFLMMASFVCLWGCSMEEADEVRRMTTFLYSTKTGKGGIRKRRRIINLVGTIISFFVLEISTIVRLWKIDGFICSAQKMSDFTRIFGVGDITLMQFLVILLIIKMVLIILYSGIVRVITEKLKTAVYAFSIGMIIAIVPALIFFVMQKNIVMLFVGIKDL